jgi:hypothetical protein
MATSSRRQPRPRFGPRPYSDDISREDAHRLMQAFDHAEVIRAPLNTPFTISFQGSKPLDPMRKQVGVRATPANTRACRDCVTRAIRSTASEFDVPLSYLFAFENPPTGGMGLHLHGLLHVPVDRREALLACLDLKLKRALDSRSNRCGAYVPVRIEEEARDFDRALGWLGYFLKGWEEPQGRIYGPRLTIGRAIYKAAQLESGSSTVVASDDSYQAALQLRTLHRARVADWCRTHLGPALRGERVMDATGGGTPAV